MNRLGYRALGRGLCTRVYNLARFGCISRSAGADDNSSKVPVIASPLADPACQADEAKLRTIAASGDLKGLLAETDTLSQKWQETSIQCYWGILAEACGDLVGHNYGLLNIGSAQNAREKYAQQALASSKDMPLGRRAYFTECLNYVPGYAVRGPAGSDWQKQRTARTEQWLNIWSQIDQLLTTSHAVSVRETKTSPDASS